LQYQIAKRRLSNHCGVTLNLFVVEIVNRNAENIVAQLQSKKQKRFFF
jgi:hypothetical protein